MFLLMNAQVMKSLAKIILGLVLENKWNVFILIKSKQT